MIDLILNFQTDKIMFKRNFKHITYCHQIKVRAIDKISPLNFFLPFKHYIAAQQYNVRLN